MTTRQPIITVAGHVDHGKCVSGDTLIPLIDGTIISAKELFENNFNKEAVRKIEDGLLQEVSKKGIKIFSFDGKEIINKNITHIWKRKAERLIEIKLASGDIIKTTPEHPFLILNELEGIWKKADELEEKSYIAIPSKINTKNSEILQTLIDKIKTLNNFVCFIKGNSAIFEKLKNRNISDIERKLKLKNLRDSIKNKRFRIKDFFILASNFNFLDKEIYTMIDSVKNSSEGWRAGHTSKEMKLPNLDELEKFGYLLGCITGDGHISQNHITLNNNDKEVQENYQEYLKQIFNIDSKFKKTHTCDMIIDCSGMTFVRFISEIIGIPKGNKSGIVFVPEIAKKNKEIFRGFFSGLLDSDGYVSNLNNSIEITSKSQQLLKECSILLLNFSIHSVVYEKNKFYTLRISNKKYLNRFLQNFNPRLKRKLTRIIDASKKAETSRIFDFLPISGKFLKELKMPGKINKKIPYFSKYNKTNKISKWLVKSSLDNIKKENEISKKLRDLFEQELDYVEIISKKEVENKEGYVYDFTVPDTHNFVAEKILVHNTTLLDNIRTTGVAASEAGGITQKISFTKVPIENIKKRCPAISQYKLDFPGFLFIDTPGHAAFSHLRKRGGGLADLAILVMDINEGIMPQTAEVISLLKLNKTPFIIALNKIDNISGWRKQSEELKKSIEMQSTNTSQQFQEKLLTIIGSLYHHGFNAKPFYEIEDFTKQVALVPCSAKTGEGVNELIITLCGISQKFLKKQLELGSEAKGVILEIKKEKTMQYAEAILYDGELSLKDEIAIASFDEPIISKIRVLEEIQPISNKFKPNQKASAANGIRMQLINSKEVLPGMPFSVFKNNLEEIKKQFQKEIGDKIKTQEKGIIIKADSLGSLEALITLLKQANIDIISAGIGKISKKDVISAQTNLKNDPINAIILGFNTEIDEEAKDIDTSKIKILTDEIIYKLIENLIKFQNEKRNEIKRERLMELATICKLSILHQYVFHNSNPAVFGVRVEAGKIKHHIPIMNENGQSIAKIKDIQENKNKVEEATQGMEVAMSLPGTNFERQLKEVSNLYSDLSEKQFREFKKNKDLLTESEMQALQKIAEIKRKEKPTWGV